MKTSAVTLLRVLQDDVCTAIDSLTEVIREAESPCTYCIGCETEHGKKGTCSSFVPRIPNEYRVIGKDNGNI